MSSSDTLTGPITLTGNATFDVTSGGTLTVPGNIGAGSASLTKDGDGVMIIEGTSSYTGTTFVTAGKLLVNGDLTSSSTIDVQTGAVLGGNGTLGPIVVGPTSTFSPGNSPDTITVSSLTLSSGAGYLEELFGNTPGNGTTGYDKTIVTAGPVVLSNANLTVSLGGGYTPGAGDVFTVIDNQSSSPVSGTFNGLAEGALVSSGGSMFRISYVGGDGNDVTLTSVFASVTVLTTAPNPSVFGQSVTFTATVTASGQNGVTPAGSVSFFDGTTILGTSVLDPSGVATLTTGTLSAGIHGITAVYSSVGGILDSTSPVILDGVNPAATSVTLANVPTSTVFGQSVTFTAIVGVNAPGAGTPTGTVWFLDGQSVLGAAALAPVSGQQTAVFTTSALSTGTHEIRAVFASGDSNFKTGSVSATVAQVVDASASTLVLDSSPQTSTYGQAVTLTAVVVAANPNAGPVTGFVNFYDGADWFGYAPVNGGVAQLSLGTIAPGVRQITAVFTGNGSINPSQSTLTQVVMPAPTTTSVAVQTVRIGWHRASSTVFVGVNALYPGQIPPSGTAERLHGRASLPQPVGRERECHLVDPQRLPLQAVHRRLPLQPEVRR